MMTLDEVRALRDVLARVRRGGGGAVVGTLAARDGHSYRDPGAMMVMTEAMEVVGGVSGGCLEEYVGRTGRELLRDAGRAGGTPPDPRPAAVLTFDTAADVPGRPTLGCGGQLDVLVEPAGPAHLAYLDAVAAAMASSDQAVSICRVGPSGGNGSPRVSRWVVVGGTPTYADAPGPVAVAVAGGPAEGLWADAVALRECVTRRAGGTTETASYLWPQPRLVLFGARDDAVPLVRVAKAAGWHVTVVDRRARLATPGRFPEADAVLADGWDRAVDRLPWTRWTAAVAMTHSFDDDVDLVPRLASLDLAYLGVLGPTSRADKLWEAIPAADRARVRSPAGLSLGDKSPGGIAVAIMAELIAARRGRHLVPRAAAADGPTPATVRRR